MLGRQRGQEGEEAVLMGEGALGTVGGAQGPTAPECVRCRVRVRLGAAGPRGSQLPEESGRLLLLPNQRPFSFLWVGNNMSLFFLGGRALSLCAEATLGKAPLSPFRISG